VKGVAAFPAASPSGFLPLVRALGDVVLYHGEFFKLVSDRGCMVWAGHLEKPLEVISRLSSLALEVALGHGDMFFIGVINFLAVVALIAASSNYDLLGALVWPPLIVFGAPLHAFASSLRRCLSTANEAIFPSPWMKMA
jgi:hypothetical protein